MDNNNAIDRRNFNGSFSPVENSIQGSILSLLIRRRWTILITTLLSLSVTFLYLMRATSIYTSTSRIYVEQSGPKIMNEYEGIMTQSNNYLFTQGELIKSTPIVAEIVDDPKIKGFRTFAGVDNLAAYIKGGLSVNVSRRDDIISVSFDSPYPVEAAEIVNAVVQAYIKFHSTRKRSTVSEILGILQKEKLKRDKELSEKFDELVEFTRENSEVSLSNQGGNIVLERLTKLSGALTEAQLNAINAKADYEATKSMKDEPAKIKQFAAASSVAGVRVSINDRETQLQNELRSAEIELKNARFHCTEDHPAVQAIHAKIDRISQELDDQAREFADSYIEVMRLRWMAVDEREKELQASFDDQLQVARDLGIKATEYSVLQSELKRTERFCDILDDRIKELNVTEDVGALNINILEVARPSGSPSKPEKTKFMAMALALGLILGGGLACLRDMMDYRLRSVDEISVVLGIPVLGAIPTMADKRTIALPGNKVSVLLKFIVDGGRRKISTGSTFDKVGSETLPIQKDGFESKPKVRSEFRSIKWVQNLSKKSNGSVNDTAKHKVVSSKAKISGIGSPIVRKNKISLEKPDAVKRGQKTYLDPKSVVAEAYRTVRTAVFFGVPKEEAKTILITSPAPHDGKSTVASNLAITMAQAGQKTLLLDADFRKPMQHNIFEIDKRQSGLSNVIAGVVNMEQAIHSGPVEGLDIIQCGAEIPNPSEVLNSDKFANILKEFAEQYDRVIIDSPPVGPVADSQILSAICDITILVLRAERSTRKHSQQARDSLQNVGGRLLGVVVNDVSRKHGRYGYYSGYGYSGYGYYGHYGYYGEEKKKVKEG